MRQIPRGYVMSSRQCWRLAQVWYWDRLDEDWQPKTAEEMEDRFQAAGLAGDFWRLTA